MLYYKENSLLSHLWIALHVFTGGEVCSKIERAVSDKCGDRKKSWNFYHISELETRIVGFPEWLQVPYQQIAPYWLQHSYMFQLRPVAIFREPHHLKTYARNMLYSIKFALTIFNVYSLPRSDVAWAASLCLPEMVTAIKCFLHSHTRYWKCNIFNLADNRLLSVSCEIAVNKSFKCAAACGMVYFEYSNVLCPTNATYCRLHFSDISWL
jgi:hypothetical protein